MRFFIKPILAGVLALSAVAPAFADPPRYDNNRYDDRGRNDRDRNDRDRGRDHDRRDGRWDRDHDRRDFSYNRHWRKGDRFDGRNNRYVVVRDYDRYRLPPPRRGQYYARTDNGDLILIAAATGLILWALNQ